MTYAEQFGVVFDDFVEAAVTTGVEEAVGPLREELSDTVAERDELREDVTRLNAENSTLSTEVTKLSDRVISLERELASCRESQQPRTRVFAASTAARSSDGGDHVKAWKRLRDGLAGQGGRLIGLHTFSGVVIPSAFGLSGTNRALIDVPDSLPVVNIKTPNNDVAGAIAGKYDAVFKAFLDSWLASGRGGYLTIDHEPENPDKNINAELFRQAWVRYARIFLAHELSKKVTFVACFMGWTFESASGRDPKAWDPLPLLTEAERKRVVLAADIYFKAQDTADRNWQRATPFFAYAKERGYRTAVFETAVNNDVNRPASETAALIREIGKRYKAESSLELLAYYESPGPAAGQNPWIDTPEEYAALATWSN